MKNIKLSLSLGLLILCFTLLNSTAFALNIQPVRYELDVEVGQHYDFEYTINKGAAFETGLTYAAEITGAKLDENGKKTLLEGEGMENEPFYSVSSWTTKDKFYSTEADNKYVITVSLDVPEDTSPGTYYFYAIMQPEASEEEEGIFSVHTRVASPFILTIPGEGIKEELILNSFELNNDNELQFIANFTNKSPIQLLPRGKITIFNEAGDQVENIITKTKTLPDGSKAIESINNDINFNQSGLKVAPNVTTNLIAKWDYRTIEPGTYKAKLEGYYGREGTFSAEADFTISEEFEISQFNADFFHTALPIAFDMKLKNNGDLPVKAQINLSISGLFGNKVYSQNLSTEIIQPNEELDITKLEWVGGFAFGYYTANLEVADNSGKIILQNIPLFVFNIWGGLILVLIIAAIIFFSIKYKHLKAKLKTEQPAQEE